LYVSEYQVCQKLLLPHQNEAAEGSFSKGPDLPESTGLFALAHADNREADINAAWNYLCKSWLPGSMYEQDESDYLEEYSISNLSARSLTLMLPIRPGRAYPEISIEKLPEQSFLVAEGTGPHAEKRAAGTIARCLAAYRPEELRNIREFYFQKQAICTARPRGRHTQHPCERVLCGVRTDEMHTGKMYTNKTANDWDARINSRESQINGKKAQINGGEAGNIRLAKHEEGYYIVLRGHTLAEFHVYQELFTSFAAQNGLKLAEGSMFGIYCTDDGFQNPRLDFYGKITLREPGQNNHSGQNNHRGQNNYSEQNNHHEAK
ncbi:MAG: hypothetical protein K2N94_02495, partial [Lachnospiraceae bacterium]|nr:hypothetical protein [Lachnospiraceae bacterium]